METMRARLEGERNDAIGKLQQLRGSGEIAGADTLVETVDEADQAQASLRQHLEVMTCERLVERIARLTEALKRLHDGSYGTCEHCGTRIGSTRLRAVPEAASCVGCQAALERLTHRRPVSV